MALKPPPVFQKPFIIAERVQPTKWNISGTCVHSSTGKGVPAVKVQAYDYVTHELVAGSVTDASGYFKLEVVENQNGYRVKPYLYGWAWCPAYYDTATEAINIKFNGINPTKD